MCLPRVYVCVIFARIGGYSEATKKTTTNSKSFFLIDTYRRNKKYKWIVGGRRTHIRNKRFILIEYSVSL